ncbi:MAG: ABC transporter substrate-binding protein, partial [Nitrososphaerales archaeon]
GLISRFPLGKNFRIALKTQHSGRSNFVSSREKSKALRLGFTRAAEYPFVIPFKKLLRNKLGITLDLRIYENGLDVARDLSLLKLDLGIAPVLTEFMLCSLGAPMKILAPAGSGGSSIVERKSSSSLISDLSDPRVASTKLSTMELLLKSSINKRILPDASKIVYSQTPNDIMKSLATNQVDAACLWEPYATILTNKREDFDKLVDYNEIGDHLCCALAAGNHLPDRLIQNIVRLFVESLEIFSKEPEWHLRAYSALTGFDGKLMMEVFREYSYPLELEPKLISKQFEEAGVQVPSPASIENMIYNF